jgi:hypothetical protein
MIVRAILEYLELIDRPFDFFQLKDKGRIRGEENASTIDEGMSS